jgi:hypothetical protein
MHTTRHETAAEAVTQVLADLAAVTDRLLGVVTAASPDAVGMATAGSILASTDRLTAATVQVLSGVTQRGVMADEGLSVGAWLRAFADRTVADERMLAATVERLADMPTVREWFLSGGLS